MTNITEEQPKVEEQEKPIEDPQTVEIPIEMYVNLKAAAIQIKTGRPITLPSDLTPDEYNFFKSYMDKQYKKLTAKVAFPPKKLKVVKD